MSLIFKILTGLISIVFACVFLLICFFNTDLIELNLPFLTKTHQLALPLILLFILGFGFLWGGLIGALQAEKIKDKLREAKKQIKSLEADLSKIKNPK